MSISFYVEENCQTIQVSYDENITCENFMLDYLKKHTNYVSLDSNVYTFKVGMKILNTPRFLKKPIKEILRANMKVTFIRKKGLSYSGTPLDFTDVSKNNIVPRGFSDNAPDYRLVKKGINLYGICKTKNCVANEQQVISDYHKDKINMIEEKYKITCPKCGGIIEPKTVGFYLCKYRIYGSKIQNKMIVDFDNGISDANDKFNSSYFDEAENGSAKFVDLIFEVISYH